MIIHEERSALSSYIIFILSFLFKGECLMTNTNRFAQFSNDVIIITAKSLPLIFKYSSKFGNNDEDQFTKLNNEFDKLIAEFGKSEAANFPVLKKRTERGLNNKPEAYYDFWFISFVQLIADGFNQQLEINHLGNEDKFGALFNKLRMYLSITRNVKPSDVAILDEVFNNSDLNKEEAIILELVLRLKRHAKEFFDNNQDDQLIDYLGSALPECIIKEKDLIGPAIDSLSAQTGDSKVRIIEDAASMLVFLAFVDDLLVRMAAKEDIAFAFNSSECLKELEIGKIAASRAMEIILKTRARIRDFMTDQSVTSETKNLFGGVFSFS